MLELGRMGLLIEHSVLEHSEVLQPVPLGPRLRVLCTRTSAYTARTLAAGRLTMWSTSSCVPFGLNMIECSGFFRPNTGCKARTCDKD